MPENIQENKLQIRAKLLSAVINLINNSQDGSFVEKTVNELKNIQNKDAILEILLKELLKENTEAKDYTISYILRELVDTPKIEAAFFEELANPKIKDSLKAKLVEILRETGKHVNYDQYISYFENPDEVIDSDTIKLLENAKINPEAQIDFLDFLSALPDSEKEMLVTSLTNDYDGDNLTNILIPVIMSNPYSEISQTAIKAIGESKSNLAYPILMWLQENIEDAKVKYTVQKSLNLLKLSGVTKDITKDYYKKLLELSPVYNCYASYPDGHGNIGLIFSRKNELNFIQMFALVVNDIDGIIDCFGFNEISEKEFERITSKFYQDNNISQIDCTFAKYLMENAEKITRLKYQEVPYEYIAWKSITNDVDYKEINIKENLEKIELNEFLMKKIYEQPYFDKWFMEKDDNKKFSELVENIENNKITDTVVFEEKIESNKYEIFNQTELSVLNHRLTMCAYMSKSFEDSDFSQILYSLTDNNEYKDRLLTDYLKKSLYQYFLGQKDKYKSLKNATSIFSRKSNKELESIDIKYIENAIKSIESSWI